MKCSKGMQKSKLKLQQLPKIIIKIMMMMIYMVEVVISNLQVEERFRREIFIITKMKITKNTIYEKCL